MSTPQRVAIEPALVAREIAFLAGFCGGVGEHAVRRLWPGQPSASSPWRPSRCGRYLVLDDDDAALAEPDLVSVWLRFLIRQFLAPVTAEALDVALATGLRGGHVVNGEVVVVDVGGVSVRANRVIERVIDGEAEVVELPRRPGRVDVEGE